MIRVLPLAVILLLSSCDSSEESIFPELREADELAAQLNAEEDFGFELHTSHWGSAPAIHVKVSDPENDPQVILKRIREAKGESTDGLLLVVRTDKFPYKGEWRERGENSQNIRSRNVANVF